MASLTDFDASTVEPSARFEPIPAGKYVAAITASETKPTNDGKGEYLAMTFQIIDGDFKNRRLWVNLNLKNKSDEAVKIARGELSAICRAVGVLKPGDSSKLHDIPMQISVKLEKRKDTGDIVNKINGYKGLTDTGAIAGPEVAPGAEYRETATPPRTYTPTTPAPWKRRNG